jgi:hypothetical protein
MLKIISEKFRTVSDNDFRILSRIGRRKRDFGVHAEASGSIRSLVS